ncbi:MAG TPA: hypothetical protein DCM08_00385 [Microscillaceae bacterium]|jgi:hypothetical protein|nr:hypothetical protein [Microscillaceae bacterium]
MLTTFAPHSFLFLNGIIWKIFLGDDPKMPMAIEIREEAGHRVTIALAELATQRLLWQACLFEQSWNKQLCGFHQNTLLFQDFSAESQLPVVEGLWAVEASTAAVLWHRAAVQFNHFTDQYVEVKRTTETGWQLEQLDWTNGQAIDSKPPLPVAMPNAKIQYPTHYPPESIFFSTFETFLSGINGFLKNKPVDYLEYAHFILISYYVQSAEQIEKMEQHLLIVDKNTGQILYKDVLAQNITQLHRDNFLVAKPYLVWLKNKNEFFYANLDDYESMGK